MTTVDAQTVAVLRAHRAAQLQERLAWGEAYQDSGLVFTREDGSALHPDYAVGISTDWPPLPTCRPSGFMICATARPRWL